MAFSVRRASPRRLSIRVSLARREAMWLYIFLLPWLLGFVLWTAGPLVASLALSLTKYDIISSPEWAGFDNYRRLFETPLFFTSLRVTLVYTLMSVPAGVVFATVMALLLNKRLPGLSVWRTVYYLPAVTSGVAIALMWSWVFQANFGVINSTLYGLFGIQGPGWFVDKKWVLPTFAIMSLWQFGAPMLIYLAALQGIPTHLYEAAEIDGANPPRKLWHITLPMVTPVIFYNIVIGIVGSFQVFTTAFVITQGGPNYASYFYVLYLYQNAFEFFKMGLASAQAWILFVIIMLFTLSIFRSAGLWVYYEGRK